ncbi:MAG TPA: hypothetical protein VJ914_03460 [Pseudonocardiaceae bacterium]|nr:hypothetical protein [Pseudonocardiaceae bacterium]
MPQGSFATDFHVDISTGDSAWSTASTVHDSGWGSELIDFATPDAPDNGGERGGQMAIGAYAPSGPNNLALRQAA